MAYDHSRVGVQRASAVSVSHLFMLLVYATFYREMLRMKWKPSKWFTTHRWLPLATEDLVPLYR